MTEEQDMIYSFQKGYWLKGVLVLLIIVLVNGCAALQLSRNPEKGESTQQTQEILVAENQQELMKGVDDSIRNRVAILSKISFDKLPEYLSAADIIAIPQRLTSDSVGQMPAKLYDAMSMAKPIIATRISDIPEVLDDCGYLVNPGKPIELAEAIRYILHHPDEASKKGRAARERCKHMYDIKILETGLREIVDLVT